MKNGRTKKISVLVPTRDHHKQLSSCLANLAEAEKEAACDIEVIILDGSPANSLATLLESRPGLHDLSWCPVEQWWNFSQIINYGAEHATGDHMLILNDDCYVPPKIFTEETLKQATGEKVGVCGFLLLHTDGRVQHSGYMFTKNPLSDTAPIVSIGSGVPRSWFNAPDQITPRAVAFTCALISKELFDRMDGLDPGFHFGMEDVDFCLRAAALKLDTRLLTNIECVHEGGASIDLLAQNFPLASPLKNAEVLRGKWGHLSEIGM